MAYLINNEKFYKSYDTIGNSGVVVTRACHGKEETGQTVYLTRDELVLMIEAIDNSELE